MKLYFSPAACSQAVHIALREAGLPADLRKVDLATWKLEDGSDYKAINPRGYVPLLELDDGSRHTEVAALLQYVADLAPASGLIPAAGTRERFEVAQWLTFVSSELHKVFSPWLWHKETADSTRAAVKEKLFARFAELDARLANQPFLTGERFTVADAYCFTIVSWAPMLALSLKPYPSLQAYLQRIAQRPAVKDVLKAEGLVKA
ncbi:glutathione transferase GstA [Ramlibacter albus]|uniref:Glutathione transferase GstA n=1 Tax=Ramlibacter albus TaxID=2079448 RepID=A0A923M7D8_9BURK|nr:glutathione transferase GstA [Ramlibacter albus]MBC5764084.1 glutathione transferase GstA [Ramlibacter albus]